jgi:isopentenyl-diphosphate delta-isomerase type 1
MDDEWLSVVDERDRVVGRLERGEVHRRGLRHRSVHVLIFNARGEVFLQRRSRHKDTAPGLWDSSAAGHVEAGEDYESCARREVQEELGVCLSGAPQPLFKLSPAAENGMEFCQIYRAVHEGPFRLNAREIEAGRWFAREAIEAWIEAGGEGLTRAFRVIWGHLKTGTQWS